MSRCPDVSVGVVIRKDESVLMVDRTEHPIGWACPGGHLLQDETPETAVRRIVAAATGLKVTEFHVGHRGIIESECNAGFDTHDWWVFFVDKYEGEPERKEPKKHRAVKWQARTDLPKLILDPAWREIFQKINFIPAA